MIKFFRKIRQKLLSENRFSKYLIYAVGEILLVVIGILIAVQINNINEQNKTYQKQRDYLMLIKAEMVSNLSAVLKEEQKLSTLLEGTREFISLRDRTTIDVSEKELSSTWSKIFSKSFTFQYENGALTELKSSGGLKDIVNDSIRNALASWEGRIQRVRLQEIALNEYIQKGNNYLEKNGAFRVIFDSGGGSEWLKIEKSSSDNSNKFLLDSQEFENILIFSIASGEFLYGSIYPEIEKDIHLLLSMIDNELNQK